MVDLLLVIQQIFNGILFGGQLALVAVGLTLIWGVTRILNFAHGAMFMMGGYAGFLTFELTGNALLALPGAVLVVFVLGMVTEFGVVRRLRDRDNAEFAAIIGTFGLAVVLENVVRASALGSTRRTLPTIVPGVWEVGPFFFVAEQVYLFIVALAALGVLFAVIKYTRLGMAMRAVAQDQNTAKLMGVRSDRIYAITFGISAALAGLAGALLAPIFNIYPSVGWQPFLLAFIVVIIGGLGSVRGTLIAALLIGVLRSVSLTFTSSQQTSMLLFLAMIVILIVKPTGIGGVIDG
ncbi:branched-chain amino acid ABC transporter permease [Haladaptatus sp. ZSTT2]|uniref:branched-chain amino acid ABC transporter permease n=1 Tax=Haladaptatus sp. ZSTT2 TaxID=3120515 RepID=UPI00300EDA2E